MDTTALDKCLNELRTDAGALAERLTALDTSLARWFDAMKAALANAATGSPIEPPAAPAATEVAPPATDTPAESPATPEGPAPVFAKSTPLAGKSVAPVASPPDTPALPPPDAEAAPNTTDNEDEALLATLDPTLAKAIRVKRRLTGNRRSVRELMEEMGATPRNNNSTRSDRKKKGWWRRGHE